MTDKYDCIHCSSREIPEEAAAKGQILDFRGLDVNICICAACWYTLDRFQKTVIEMLDVIARRAQL
jgi:hypothetical protein